MRVRTRHEGIILLLWLEFNFFFAIARENDCAIVRRFCTRTRYLTVLIFVPTQNIFFYVVDTEIQLICFSPVIVVRTLMFTKTFCF